MRILIVDGNTEEGNANAVKLGMRPYCETYAQVMQDLQEDVIADIAHPSEIDRDADKGHNSWFHQNSLENYDGFVWTGSPLNLYNVCDAIQNQLAFGEKLLKTGKPIFGSCWGLQINTQLLGGKVRKNPKGREIGIARNIMISPEGLKHPLYENKPKSFNALAIHLDEVEQAPSGASILASNDYSEIQAMGYETNGVDFWGVQYHPEFNFEIMSFIYKRIGQSLINEGYCRNQEDVDTLIKDYQELYHYQIQDKNYRKDLVFRYGLTSCVAQVECHKRELYNWLTHAKAVSSAKTLS